MAKRRGGDIRAGVYARISSDRSDTRLGVDRQVKDCKALCADRGWVVDEVFVDNDVSATSGKRRPEYNRLLTAIESGDIDAVAVWDLDRLTRRPAELESFVATCERGGASQLAFVGGGVDLGTGDGMLVARIKGAVAAEEARKTGQRMRRKKQELAERGLPSGGGRRAFGWERDGQTVRESEAALIREAAEVVLRGGSLRGIATDWEARGVQTVGGGTWRPNSVKAVLRNPRNAGLRQHGREVVGTTKAGRPAFGRPIIVGDASWPPIIERDIWERLQLLFENPERSHVKVQTRSYPLRGVLECGVCGRKLTSVPRKKPIPSDPDRRMRYYGCRSDQGGCGKIFVDAQHAEQVVDGVILRLLSNRGAERIALASQKGDEAEAAKLLQQNAKDNERIADLEDAFAAGDLSREGLRRTARPLRERIAGRTSRITGLQGFSMLYPFTGHVEEHWDQLTDDDRRSIVLSFLVSVRVKPKARGGFNRFDPKRLVLVWRYGGLARLSENRETTMTGPTPDDEDLRLPRDLVSNTIRQKRLMAAREK